MKAQDMQNPSSSSVVALYDGAAESYASMMDEEIKLPVYAETLARLSESISGVPGAVVDTSCGTGHMLWLYRARYDPERTVIGIDLSPRMVAVARSRLGQDAQIVVGDMRRLTELASSSVAGIISFFAIHHLDSNEVKDSLSEWHRVLRTDGRVVLAAWEGSGLIDYGGTSDVIAYKHAEKELTAWVGECGFRLEQCRVETVKEMGMDAVYLGAASV
ncbi:MAG: class I SAM-dependent methyltransferase [Polyangiaceae bacterium]